MTFNVWDIFRKISTWVETQTDIFNVNMKAELFFFFFFNTKQDTCIFLIHV